MMPAMMPPMAPPLRPPLLWGVVEAAGGERLAGTGEGLAGTGEGLGLGDGDGLGEGEGLGEATGLAGGLGCAMMVPSELDGFTPCRVDVAPDRPAPRSASRVAASHSCVQWQGTSDRKA